MAFDFNSGPMLAARRFKPLQPSHFRDGSQPSTSNPKAINRAMGRGSIIAQPPQPLADDQREQVRRAKIIFGWR